jgi:hypothetical protein
MQPKQSILAKLIAFGRALTVALLLLWQAVSGFATTYYVAPNGMDTNSGASSDPFATIMRAQTAATSGDTVYLRGDAKAAVVIENCWAFYNGYFTNFASSGGDANGFKSGGYGVNGSTTPPNPVPRHVTRFCLAARNRANGFYANHHTGGLDWLHNTACRNGRNYNLLCNLDAQSSTNDVPGFDHVMKNNLGHQATASEVSNLGPTNDTSHNYFTLPVTVDTNDFMSFNEALLTLPRQTNGELPYTAFAQLVSASDAREAGTNAGFAFVGLSPDLGAFEYGIRPGPTLAMLRIGTNLVFSAGGGPAGGTNHLEAAADPALSAGQWTRVATNVFDVTGSFEVTNAMPPGVPQRFHRIALP